MDDKVKIKCPACKTVFREKCTKVRDGNQLNCTNCNKLITSFVKPTIRFCDVRLRRQENSGQRKTPRWSKPPMGSSRHLQPQLFASGGDCQ